jgi:hypothetical protein
MAGVAGGCGAAGETRDDTVRRRSAYIISIL